MAIVGGKLQGTEAAYLAKKAGLKTLVIDKQHDTPASGLCDDFLEFEFTPGCDFPKGHPPIDLILPALEDEKVLGAVQAWSTAADIPLAFDLQAFALSSSKLRSDTLFRDLGLLAPVPWPDCPFPVVVKPDRASGSRDVRVFETEKALLEKFPDPKDLKNRVIQAHVPGPSFSIEVMGKPGDYRVLEVTDLFMDKDHDCRRVTAPTTLGAPLVDTFKETAVKLAQEIGLAGIMDLEAILNRDRLHLLEIDARLPSQTPTAVYWSWGINMVSMLAQLFLDRPVHIENCPARPALVEHIRVTQGTIQCLGEHIMAQDGPLSLKPGFFGADEALTSFAPGKAEWVATLIFSDPSTEGIKKNRAQCYEAISRSFGENQ